jgi:hypothetical protein
MEALRKSASGEKIKEAMGIPEKMNMPDQSCFDEIILHRSGYLQIAITRG